MRNRKNCLAVLLMTAIVITGCGNQQAEKENPSVVAQKTSSVQNESEDGEKNFLSTYQNIAVTLPEGWNVTKDEKIQCSFVSEDGESLEISYREGMAKVVLMDFPENEESAEKLLYPNEITGENSISDFVVKTVNEGKSKESFFYRFWVKNSLQIPTAFFCGVKTENEGYQIIWKKGNNSSDTQQTVPEILESLQFPDNELLRNTSDSLSGAEKCAGSRKQFGWREKAERKENSHLYLPGQCTHGTQHQHKPGPRSSDDRGRSGNARKREWMVQDFV